MRLLETAALAVLIVSAPAAADVEEAWVDRLDGPASMNDYGEAVAIAADGSAYVAGFVFEQVDPNLFAPRFMTIKYAPGGAREWTRTYAGTFASGAAAAGHVAVDADGNIVVAGSTNQGDDWAVVKYDPAGNELWRTVYEANSSFLTEPDDMALDGEGNIYLVGTIGDFIDSDAGALVKVGPDGTVAWAERYHGPTLDGGFFRAVAVGDFGHVYAGGGAVVPDRGTEFAVIQYDASGNQQWVAFDGYPGAVTHDRVAALAPDGNGGVVAAGLYGSNSVLGVDVAVVRYDADGTQLWERTYAGPAARTDAATGAVVDANGDVIVVGYSGTSNGFSDYDALVLKYDAAGAFLWERRVSGDEQHSDHATSVAVDAGRNVYMAGGYDPIGGERFFATRYAPDGTQEWFADYAGPLGGGSTASDIAVGGDGVVYVTGDSPDAGTALDIVTIRYDQPGGAIPGDLDDDGDVDVSDLLAFFADWGACADCADCAADLDGDCDVDTTDLLLLLANWS